MEKQKNKFNILVFLFVACCTFLYGAGQVDAAASAVVSWTPPTTDEGGGTLTGLAGYKLYYNTTSSWLNHVGTCLPGLGTVVDVSGGSTASYRLNNNLTPGQTYYFAVAAYDAEATPNVSGCAIGSGGVTEVSKLVSYSGDINLTPDHAVNSNDFTILATDYGRTSFCGPENKSDINGDCTVNANDFTLLAEDYGSSF